MCLVSEGIYRRLLDFQWEDGYLDDDHEELMAMVRATPEQWATFSKFLDRCFPICEDGKRRNPRMDEDRKAAEAKCQANSLNGQKGGRPSAKPTQSETEPKTPEKKTETKANGNRTETERLAKQNRTLSEPKAIPETETTTEPERKITSWVEGEGSGGREIAEQTPPPEPAWWSLEPDSWECELAETVRGSRGYGSFTPDEKRLRALIARVRGFCPDRESFTEVLAGWVDRAKKKSSPEYSDPILALGKWFGMREAEWRKVKRNRQIDEERAAKGQVGYTPSRFAGMSAEERLRALEAEDGAA